MTRNGFILCNDKYVKVRDEHGLVNFIGAAIKYSEEDLRRAIEHKQMMDNSLNIPADLIIRSLPLNIELIEQLREKREREGSVVENISKFIQID